MHRIGPVDIPVLFIIGEIGPSMLLCALPNQCINHNCNHFNDNIESNIHHKCYNGSLLIILICYMPYFMLNFTFLKMLRRFSTPHLHFHQNFNFWMLEKNGTKDFLFSRGLETIKMIGANNLQTKNTGADLATYAPGL